MSAGDGLLVAIETATDTGSVALGTADTLLGEVVLGVRTRHAELLLPALDFLLRTTHTPRGRIAGIVVGAGPGSFTGVRVAAATARGLAQGLDVPLLAFSSLAALAAAVPVEGPVCALFDARRGEVYAACYERGEDGRLRTLLAPVVATVGAVQQQLAGRAPHWVGEGAVRYAAELGIAPPPPHWPRASALLQLAAGADDGARVDAGGDWEPMYLRASGAERGIAG